MSVVSEFHSHDVHFPSHTIYLGDEINAEIAAKTIKNLLMLDATSKNIPITLLINNLGGDTYDGLALYDAIQNCKKEVIGKVYGQACSAASFILQACDSRLISQNGIVMIHYGSFGMDDHPKIVQQWVEFQRRHVYARMENIYLERIREKHPNFTHKMIQYRLNFDTIYNATDAVALGLADEVI